MCWYDFIVLSASTTVKVVVEVIKLLTFLESVEFGCIAAIRILVFKRLGAVLFGKMISALFSLFELLLLSTRVSALLLIASLLTFNVVDSVFASTFCFPH